MRLNISCLSAGSEKSVHEIEKLIKSLYYIFMKKKAILYTTNFEKLATLAQYLVHDNWEILSAGVTAKFLKDNNIPYTFMRQLETNANTDDNFITLMHMILASGRKLLASSIYTESVIDLVCMNVEPSFRKINDFKETDKTDNCIDLKDITLLHAAAKNYMNVVVLCDPDDYGEAIIQMKTDSMSDNYRLYLAGKAMNLISAYDAASAASVFLGIAPHDYPKYFTVPYKLVSKLHHGSNDHQTAVLYSINDQFGALTGMKKIQGKEMNYNLYQNCFAAWKAVSTFTKVLKTSFTVESYDCNDYPFTTQFTPAAGSVFTIGVKNTNPVGAALGSNLYESIKKTVACSPNEFNGCTFGCSSIVDEAAARELLNIDCRTVIAPDFTKEAKAIFGEKKDMRLVIASKPITEIYESAVFDGGLMVQQPDNTMFKKFKVVTQTRPTQVQVDSMAFGMMLAMMAKSDAALVINDFSTVGISAGSTSRSRAVRFALQEAREYFEKNQNNLTSQDRNAEILVSDSVIYFDEFVKSIADIGVKAIIQTGGTPQDEEFIQYCNEHGISMIFTGLQHLSV